MYKNIAIVIMALLVLLLGAHGWQLRQNGKAMQTAIDAQKTELDALKTKLEPIITGFEKMQEMRQRFHNGPPDGWQPPADGEGNQMPPPGMDGQDGRRARTQNGQRPPRRLGRGSTATADGTTAPAPGEPVPAGQPAAEPAQ